MQFHPSPSLFLTAVVAAGCFLSIARADRVVRLDGQSLPGTVESIDEKGIVSGSGLPEGLPLDALRRIERSAPPDKISSRLVVEIAGGGKIAAEGVTMADDKCIIRWAGREIAVPLEFVRLIRFEADKIEAAFEQAAAQPTAENDRIFLRDGERLQTLAGLVESLDDGVLRFQFRGKSHQIDRGRMHGIIVAQLDGGNRRDPALVTFADGSRFSGKIESLAGGKLSLLLPGKTALEIPWSDVAQVDVRSERLVFLSELEPDEVDERPIVTLPRSWQRDRAVTGGPLVLVERGERGEEKSQRQFARGIGVHAGSRLVFAAEGSYARLAAVIGIDVSAQGRGDCLFKVLADDKEVYSHRMTGRDSPREINVDISGARRVTLLVEPGEGLDLGDHADWCDARLIKGN